MPPSIRFIPSIRPFTKVWDQVTDLDWFTSQFKLKRITVSSLIGSQSFVRISGVIKANWQRPIYVVRIGGKNYIRDGHHRVMRARLRQQKTIHAQVLNLGE